MNRCNPPTSLRAAAACALLLALAGLAGCAGRSLRPPLDPPAAATPAAAAADPAAPGIHFADVAARAGVVYRWPVQPRPMRNIEAFGSGCAFLDYDDDGWMDILLVASPTPKLFHNRGDGTFEDVTVAAGLDKIEGRWTGVAVGDYDGDGRLDILLTGYHRLALLHNETTSDERPTTNVAGTAIRRSSFVVGRFRDVTREAGLDPTNRGHWGSSAAFMDLDGSGRLALIILNYVIMGPHEKQYCELTPGVKSGCPPAVYRPEFAELWQNLGNGRFRDITAQSGMKNTHGKALVIAFADVDDDGKIDFYIGNDGMDAELMHNLGGLRFENIGAKSGTDVSEMGHAIAAMGADWADYDRDGRLDLAVSAFSDEVYSVFHALGGGRFEHTESALGIAGPTLKPLGFGTKWLDVDNDGWPDLAYANGHVYDSTNQIDPMTTFRQPMMLFHNEPAPTGNGRMFYDLVPKLGGDLAKPLLGRGMATGDFDNDGRVDLLVVDFEGDAVLLHNESRTPNHWITFDLRGAGANKFAYGAKVTARAGKSVWVAHVSPASSYLSSSDPRIHFGLGQTTRLDSVTVRWPDGRTEIVRGVAADRFVRLTEGRGASPQAVAAVASAGRR